MSNSTLALVTVPFLTGVIGYVTNWTGVLMLFYPVHFKGIRARWLQAISRLLPYKLRQIPGVMIGGIGWQGIVPSRAAKMGSLAVDSGISKIGTPHEFFEELDPEQDRSADRRQHPRSDPRDRRSDHGARGAAAVARAAAAGSRSWSTPASRSSCPRSPAS